MKKNASEILDFLSKHSSVSSKEIEEGMLSASGYATVKRTLIKLIADNLVSKSGLGKSTKYSLSITYQLLRPILTEEYFQKEIDERQINPGFNHLMMESFITQIPVFSDSELQKLNRLQQDYRDKISTLSKSAYKKELDRLAIDLSWKSSQIEGNTYSLLETERLLKEKETAAGKTKEEAIMLLNHKAALDFIINEPEYLVPLTVGKIEDIHSLLVKDLDVERNIRKHSVGISGTNYKPLDNQFQIREAVEDLCRLINKEENVFVKALLVLVMISYIQAFSDGNKRTARIISNAILLANNYCPMSFRTVNSIDYKKSMLIFYEQNNISAFKKIFIDQFEFAVKTYF